MHDGIFLVISQGVWKSLGMYIRSKSHF